MASHRAGWEAPDPPDPDSYDLGMKQPRCRHCNGFLRWEPEEETVTVGEPGQEFTEVQEYRTCRKCGERHLVSWRLLMDPQER